MIRLAQLMRDHQEELIQRYNSIMEPRHYYAMQSMIDCHTSACGEVQYDCHECSKHQHFAHACGNRSCPACQHKTNNEWLDRQRQKLLPVDYYMVTFTLPAELRNFVWHHQKWAYQTLFNVARQTLLTFAKNDKKLNATLGLTGVLHTNSRRLDYHPHVHFIVPNGGFSSDKKYWKQKAGKYLFNGRKLARVFRAKFIEAMKQKGYTVPKKTPSKWITQCESVGRGETAFVYLARYLYRGVITEKNIIKEGENVISFKYQENQSKQWKIRTEPTAKFLWLVLQHVLPKGFRRARDYGFLHSNAKRTLKRLQLILKVKLSVTPLIKEPECKQKHPCPKCGLEMLMTQIFKPKKQVQTTN